MLYLPLVRVVVGFYILPVNWIKGIRVGKSRKSGKLSFCMDRVVPRCMDSGRGGI